MLPASRGKKRKKKTKQISRRQIRTSRKNNKKTFKIKFMKRICNFSIIQVIIFGLVSILNSSCDKEVDPKLLPILTTTEVIKMTEATAYSGGNITSDAGSDVSSRGVCWSETPNPTIEDKKTIDAAGTGEFKSRITGLNPATTYYVRAYASNKKGIAYGLQVTFKTKSLTITTNPITSTTISSAVSGGTLETDGDSLNVYERGICWSNTSNPTIENSKIANGKGKGKYTASIAGLQIATQYFVRAYAKNETKTIYGDELSFSTPNTITDIDGNVYKTVIIGTQTWMVENLRTTKYNDGMAITNITNNASWSAFFSAAFCWYNNDVSNKNLYGALYNWYAVKTHKLAPIGWHIPTDTDWTILTNYVLANLGSSNSVAKNLAANIIWSTHTSDGAIGCDLTRNNNSGFSAIPGGYRHDGGKFDGLSYLGLWWSVSEYSTSNAWSRYLGYSENFMDRSNNSKTDGFSVRCIKD